MMKSVEPEELDSFLARHDSVEADAHFRSGDLFGRWRVTAFLGRGGSGEVYRVVDVHSGADAALKVLVRNTEENDPGAEVARIRFENEIGFLSAVKHASFPVFLDRGETNGRPWYVMELLEDRELPSDDAGVADFVLKISKCVQFLHAAGYVHRDIKPGNIMYRSDGTPVLADMGLLKRFDRSTVDVRFKNPALSVVDGKAVGVGTPRFSAPEQFIGGEISPASDIHALGMLINECFGGGLKGCWEGIVARATSSIPERRYRDVAEFMLDIRRRHRLRRLIAVFGLILLSGVFCWALSPSSNNVGRERIQSHGFGGNTSADAASGDDLILRPDTFGENMSTSVCVKKELVVDRYITTKAGSRHPVMWHWRLETNAVDITLIRLDDSTRRLDKTLLLSSERETWIVGPGVFDASLECGEAGAKVRIENCLFNNRSKILPSKSKIRYELAGGACLNFTGHEDDPGWRDCVEPFDSAYNDVRFKGPETIKEYNLRLQEERHTEMQRHK